MSTFERLLVPGSTEMPDCRCGKEMHIASVIASLEKGAEIRVYQCRACQHEMRLTVWMADEIS
jgi:hypothetical protein